jgi:hypothetical protein
MRIKQQFLILALFVFVSACALGQTQDRPIVISPLMGDTLDAKERGQYRLFPAFEGFQWAVFYLNADSSLKARVMLLQDGIQRDTVIEHYRKLSELRYRIEQIDRIGAKGDITGLEKITLKDGSEVIGTIESQDAVSMKFKTLSNIEMTIPKEQMKSIGHLSGDVIGGEYQRSDPNHTRLLFAPTARALKAGQGYFSAYEIFFPFVAIGVTDFISLAGGMSLFPGISEQLFYFAPKVRFLHLQNLDVAGGVLFSSSTAGSSGQFGIVYGVGTWGTADASLTAGLGWGFAGDELSASPVIMIGGELRASNSVKFISENWIPPKSKVVLLSLGVRFFGEHLAADIALALPAGIETRGFPFIPWLGFAYNFGSQ